MKEIGCKSTWSVHISSFFWAIERLLPGKIWPRPAEFSLRFFKSDRLPGKYGLRFFLSFLALLLCANGILASASQLEPLTNQLSGHPSPYLAMHGSDPVAWQEWNAETVARARRENKLLYVSVGYFACHWCHVMQRESYNNPEIAALLNRDFIPVKIDRELNSGMDEALQLFSARLNGIAGWPLNAFVTPEGYPSFVVLYAPPPQFHALLLKLSGRWDADKQAIRRLAQQAAPPASTRPARVVPTSTAVASAQRDFIAGAWQEADHLHGGFGQVGKFPMAPQLSVLLDSFAQQGDAKLGDFLRLTLDQMAARALRDQVGGGFFRYTIDPAWDTPHFEKMLYDNAQLALLYLQAAGILQQPAYRSVAKSALDFMVRELQDASGGLYSSTSAVDEQGREGAAYLWEPAALKSLLSPASYAAAFRVWQLGQAQLFEQGYLPAEYQTPTDAERAPLSEAYARLRMARLARKLPLDLKMNAGLNGLALSAFSRAQLLDPAYRRSADRIARFLMSTLIRDDHLLKARSQGHLVAGAELEDYAYVVQGLLDYAEINPQANAPVVALKLARTAWSLFWTPTGWRREARPLLASLRAEPVLADGALPSPSEVLNLASLRLGDAALTQQVKRVAAWRSPEQARDPFAYPTRLHVLKALRY